MVFSFFQYPRPHRLKIKINNRNGRCYIFKEQEEDEKINNNFFQLGNAFLLLLPINHKDVE